ncbi:MAG: fructose-bisphosphate aldolase class I [Candidatus Nomurabacteria bacterium]|jgi:fructose-bisphosphate aldolase class I|nr:fructose-bisphosphate aldolase class I [Candidatus Nomurabacteria bacterium]
MNIVVKESKVGATKVKKNVDSALRRYLLANPSLSDLVQFIFINNRGILAADESGGSIAKKFAAMKIEDNEKNRRDYRNIFLSAEGLENYCGGVIMFEETAAQKADNGQLFGDLLLDKNILPGIKLDRGLVELPNFAGETWTRGLDDLAERLEKYFAMGFRFAKWRAAFQIVGNKLPSATAMDLNTTILAVYASLCQNAGIVPIVEPEVVHDGDYNIETCALATTKIIKMLMEKLSEYRVDLTGTILKCNMVLAGKKYVVQSSSLDVAEATISVLKNTVAPKIGAVVFLSGGQTPEQAAKNFHAIKNLNLSEGVLPFPVSFSFARALQDPALTAWCGKESNFGVAQKEFVKQLQRVAE